MTSNYFLVFPSSSVGKESAWNEGDLGSVPGSGRSSREGNGYPVPYSCLENPTDRGAWRATDHTVKKRQTWPSDLHNCHYHSVPDGHTLRSLLGGEISISMKEHFTSVNRSRCGPNRSWIWEPVTLVLTLTSHLAWGKPLLPQSWSPRLRNAGAWLSLSEGPSSQTCKCATPLGKVARNPLSTDQCAETR